MTWQVIQGDCVEQMREFEEASVDAVVCDPPYGLEFMGKEWDRLDAGLPQENVWKGRRGKGGSNIGTDDSKPGSRHHVALGAGKKHAFKRCTICGKRQFSGTPCECPESEWSIEYPDGAPSSSIRMQRWHEVWAREALRVLKPGGHLLAFGGTRTSHRLACAIEDASFEIRDTICWLYGSGFPKSLDVSKAIDRQAGAEREVVERIRPDGKLPGRVVTGYEGYDLDPTMQSGPPATPEAKRWQGWGTALKPAHEPIVVARKPLAGTVAQNVLETGCGALNIDATRESPSGRWPSNVVLDEEVAWLLDEQTGERRSAGMFPGSTENGGYGGYAGAGVQGPLYEDSGGASRFFYCPKSSRAERNAGLEGFEEKPLPMGGHGNGEADPISVEMGSQRTARNSHPTVKPISLMRWLVRLITSPGGTVLDPFVGSGTTGCAAVLEGFDFIGIEREPEYARIAEARIAWWDKHKGDGEADEILRAGEERDAVEATGQLGLEI